MNASDYVNEAITQHFMQQTHELINYRAQVLALTAENAALKAAEAARVAQATEAEPEIAPTPKTKTKAA